ncbi:MAG: hypothetical protein VYC34_10490, partial [Planctomycetota bacterium]|nr:hypothetical protein [Planctomycetota bacterium]
LNRVASIQNVTVLNLNEIANALKPNVIPGDTLRLRLIKRGEQAGQGVGYLDDGTMVVAEDGAASVGEDVSLTITSALQTSAGRLIFGRIAPESPRDGAGRADAEEAPPQPEPTARGVAVAAPRPREDGADSPSPPADRRRPTPRNPRRS